MNKCKRGLKSIKEKKTFISERMSNIYFVPIEKK